MDNYDDVIRKLLSTLTPEQRLEGLSVEQCLAGMSVEQRLAGMSVEQRLAGVAPEERLRLLLLALPDDALRVLSEEYIATLPVATRDAIRRRLGR